MDHRIKSGGDESETAVTVASHSSGAKTRREDEILFPSPRAAAGRVGEFHVSEMSRGGGTNSKVPPTLTPPHHALARGWRGNRISFSRRVRRPSHAKPLKKSSATNEGRRSAGKRTIHGRATQSDVAIGPCAGAAAV